MTRRRITCGNALIEFAIGFGVLFPILYGTFEFGYAFFIYNQLKNATREAARYASLKTYNTNTSQYTSAYGTAVKNMVVYGDPNGGTTPIVSGLSAGNVSLTVVFARNKPGTVIVRIQNYPLDTVFQTFHLNKPSCSFPYSGRYAPAGI